MIDLTIKEEQLERTIQLAHERNIIIPTLKLSIITFWPFEHSFGIHE